VREDGTVLGTSTRADAKASSSDRETLGELFGAASRDFSELVRKEVELAKVELKEEAVEAGKAGAFMGAGGLLGYQALLILLLAVAWLLAEVMPIWAGLLIVALVVGVVAAVLVMSGKKKIGELSPPVPNTIETLQEDAQWAKQQLS